MPSDKPPSVSFNQWLSLQGGGEYAPVLAVWVTSRGRLTRDTVVRRVTEADASLGALAGRAFDAYLVAASPARRLAKTPDPRQLSIVEEADEGNAILSLDPSIGR